MLAAATLILCALLAALLARRAPATVGASCPQSPAASAPSGAPVTSPGAGQPGATQPGPEEILACVGPTPITGALLAHWENIASRSGGAKHPPTASEIAQEVMGFLVSSDWVLGEAGDLGIHLSPAAVSRKFEKLRREQFPKRREFNAFLTKTGQTVPDLLLRVRLNLLSQRIQAKVSARQHGAKAQQRALKRFVHAFQDKWKAQTYCDPRYTIPGCGHELSAG